VIPLRDENPTSRRAYVTLLLIALNIGIFFFIQFPHSGTQEESFDYERAGVPCEVHTGKPITVVPEGAFEAADFCTVPAIGLSEPVRPFPHKNVWIAVFVSMFLHGSVEHVLGNMLFLWIFGNNVEDQLGHVAYLALYLVGGIVASAVHIVGNLNSNVPFLGASGAIAVILGAYFVWFPRARVLTLLFFFIPIYLPAVVFLGLWFVLQFGTQSSSGIATLAHIGGFVFGAVVALALKQAAGLPRERSPRARSRY
jgi:membrane associated rhomboid family serine protease